MIGSITLEQTCQLAIKCALSSTYNHDKFAEEIVNECAQISSVGYTSTQLKKLKLSGITLAAPKTDVEDTSFESLRKHIAARTSRPAMGPKAQTFVDAIIPALYSNNPKLTADEKSDLVQLAYRRDDVVLLEAILRGSRIYPHAKNIKFYKDSGKIAAWRKANGMNASKK